MAMASRHLSSRFSRLRGFSPVHPRPVPRIRPFTSTTATITTTTSQRSRTVTAKSWTLRNPAQVGGAHFGGGRRWYSQTPTTAAAEEEKVGKVGEGAEGKGGKAEKAEVAEGEWKKYIFDEIKHLSLHPRPQTIIIDVREPSEVRQGAIPTSINLPLNSSPDALLLSPETFAERFGFEKPDTEKEVVFYCKRGIRSRAAVKVAFEGGYKRVSEFPGAWDEWVERGGVA